MKGKNFIKLVYKGIKLMRMKCMEEKMAITKDNIPPDNEEVLKILGDQRFDTCSGDITGHVLNPDFY